MVADSISLHPLSADPPAASAASAAVSQGELLATSSLPIVDGYQCPGEPYPISRAVHLARLAAFYPKCPECPHRIDQGTISSSVARQLPRFWERRARTALFADEEFAGRFRQEFTPQLARELATVFATWLATQATAEAAEVSVLLAAERTPHAIELVDALSQALRHAGCQLIDVGAATAPALVYAQQMRQATGAVLLGSRDGQPQTATLRLWGPAGRPCSTGGSLDALAALWQRGANRPTRTAGGIERWEIMPAYWETIAEHFHALRPLRWVVDCSSDLFADGWERLAGTVDCTAIPLEQAAADECELPRRRKKPLANEHAPELAARLERLGQRVRGEQAHFGALVDREGEALLLVDERGVAVAAERVALAIARHRFGKRAVVLLEQTSASSAIDHAHKHFVLPATCVAAREATYRDALATQAQLAGGPSGRIWWADAAGLRTDALRSLAMVLEILSTSDRAVSQVFGRR